MDMRWILQILLIILSFLSVRSEEVYIEFCLIWVVIIIFKVPQRIIYSTPNAPLSIGPYNQAIQLDNVFTIHINIITNITIILLNPFTGQMVEGVVDQARYLSQSSSILSTKQKASILNLHFLGDQGLGFLGRYKRLRGAKTKISSWILRT